MVALIWVPYMSENSLNQPARVKQAAIAVKNIIMVKRMGIFRVIKRLFAGEKCGNKGNT
jgi:hypothetical protein